MENNLRTQIQKKFVAGLLALVPLVITYVIVKFLFETADAVFRPLMIKLIDYLSQKWAGFNYYPGLGIVGAFIIILLIGIIATNLFGKKIFHFLNLILSKIPVVRSVYSASKQFVETVHMANSGKEKFTKVVLVDCFQKGYYSIGFITSESEGEAEYLLKKQLVNVFIPTTPNPTSGMLFIVGRENVIPLSMSVEDGITLVVSGGIVNHPYNGRSGEPDTIKI